ncbi:MAG TPA: hypothetical protein DDY13_17945 [Cytophagales bacterium]|jgi:hypothetical protein|nr:hypothetical protein [Cytophagales bacterium]
MDFEEGVNLLINSNLEGQNVCCIFFNEVNSYLKYYFSGSSYRINDLPKDKHITILLYNIEEGFYSDRFYSDIKEIKLKEDLQLNFNLEDTKSFDEIMVEIKNRFDKPM